MPTKAPAISPQAPASCRLATIGQLAEALHVHKDTCGRWLSLADAGLKPGFPRRIHLGDKAVRVKWADVETYIAALAGGTVQR